MARFSFLKFVGGRSKRFQRVENRIEIRIVICHAIFISKEGGFLHERKFLFGFGDS